MRTKFTLFFTLCALSCCAGNFPSSDWFGQNMQPQTSAAGVKAVLGITGGGGGTNGLNGLNGTNGLNGANGTNGLNGANGTNGLNGLNGGGGTNAFFISGTNIYFTTVGGSNQFNLYGITSGTNGLNGLAGTSGTNGLNGLSGTNGINGTNGLNGTSGAGGTNALALLLNGATAASQSNVWVNLSGFTNIAQVNFTASAFTNLYFSGCSNLMPGFGFTIWITQGSTVPTNLCTFNTNYWQPQIFGQILSLPVNAVGSGELISCFATGTNTLKFTQTLFP